MAAKKNLRNIVANAINKADNSYFFEDYSKQSREVLKAIEGAGFRIIPKELDESEFKTIADSMKMGKMRPEQHSKNVYETFVKYWESKRY